MTYAFVQKAEANNSSSVTSYTITVTPTAGNLLIFFAGYANGSATTITMSDGGAGNTFSEFGTGLFSSGPGYGSHCFYAANCKGGSTTFTFTLGSASSFNHAAVYEYSGILTTSPLVASAFVEVALPGSGTDAINTGDLTASSQPDLLFGFCLNIATTSQVSGTGFTSQGNVWGGAGTGEDKRIIAVGAVTNGATFTDPTPGASANYHVLGALFGESAGAAAQVPYPEMMNGGMIVQICQ